MQMANVSFQVKALRHTADHVTLFVLIQGLYAHICFLSTELEEVHVGTTDLIC